MGYHNDTPSRDDTTRADPKAAHYCEPVEWALLSALLRYPGEWSNARMLTPADFTDRRRDLFIAMRASAPDFASVETYLRQKGTYNNLMDVLMAAWNDEAGANGINPGWVETMKACALRRRMWEQSELLAGASVNTNLDPIEVAQRAAEHLHTLADAALSDDEAAPVQSLGDLAFSYWEAVAERKKGAATGFAELDKKIGGLQPERLYVLLGGTGSGKTTLANQIAEHIASASRPVFYITSEDAPSTLLAKAIARLGQVDYSAVLYGHQAVKQDIDTALSDLVERKSYTFLAYLHDTGAFSLAQMIVQARRHFEQFADAGPGVLVIDYLQRMARMQPGPIGQDTRDLVTRYTMALRAVAEELGCSVLALSSMNRASYNGKGDTLASAKESGDIEYTADVILALSEDEKGQAAPGHKAMTLQLAKNRLGPAGEPIKLDWQGIYQKFAGVA